jgi:hypothetical protein
MRVLVAGGILLAATALPTSDTRVQAAESAATRTSFSWQSPSPEDHIGQGQSGTLTASSTVVFRLQGASPAGLRVDVLENNQLRFSIALHPGAGDVLRPGVFPSAELYPFQTGRAPGMSIQQYSRACSHIFGSSFEIRQLGFTSTGALNMLEATFTQRCGAPTAPALTAQLMLNALPLTYSYRSEVGDHIGKGTAKSYSGARSVIRSLDMGIPNRTALEVSGLRDRWTFQLAGPNGTRLAPGTYSTTSAGSATKALLNVSANAAACNTSTGTLRVYSIWHRTDGVVGGMHATFTQRCDGHSGGMSGTIRYLA